ncbi:DUF349 domain-containing protein [Mesonia sp. K7]|uniref:DUF349 domain-containing protein n=1 Tax=Mesonia sp. K7 TaxID=2218606 RepID=UPI000DA99C57|nr:DUF349 domain-containing protein [Mesonia sp. K7]PZD79467.1 DUF349 domain-containing protein [Mesonia sp. K7]
MSENENIKHQDDEANKSANFTENPTEENQEEAIENQAEAEVQEEDDLPQEEVENTAENHHKAMHDAIAEESEDEEVSKRHDIELKDYHSMSQAELIREIRDLVKNEKVQAIREHVQEIRHEFNSKFDEEYEQKKEEFIEEGGNEIDFHYATKLKNEFDSLYFDYKEKRNNHFKDLKKNLNENLKNRLAIIEELKGMIGAGADMQSNFNDFKELQERWKKAGPIPRDNYNTVWNDYHHHVERFYDFLHLDREFRDLDFKHNLEQKLKMIARAEELAQETNINRAFRELQMLHKMWKEDVGPVAREYREEIWDKFSEATKKIHENRQAYFEELDKGREKNLERKNEIISKINDIAQGEITSHHNVQENIKKVEALREDFFKAGKVPREANEPTWKSFKESVRKFNRKKNAFYKDLKKEQYQNLEKKMELVKIAEDNKDSEDFKATTPLMKKIQADWKKIGHVPRKDSDKIWKRFKGACNAYFERLHAIQDEENKEEMEAFEKKKQLLDSLKELEMNENPQENLDLVKAKIAEWKQIGRVPYKMRYIEGKFNKALDKFFSDLDISKKEAEMLKYENKLQALDEANDDRKIEKEAFFVSKKIDETKAEIRQLENNLQFFSNVDESNPLVKEVLKNIERHKTQLETWKAKLRKLRQL